MLATPDPRHADGTTTDSTTTDGALAFRLTLLHKSGAMRGFASTKQTDAKD
jgi:hypothetical protein